MEVSALFYGHYDGTFKFYLYDTVFDYPLAYFLVMLSVFGITLVAVVYSSAKSFHASSYADTTSCEFSNLVFGSWDTRINKKSAVVIQQTDMLNRFRRSLAKRAKKIVKEERRTKDVLLLYLVRIVVNLMILAMLAGSFFAIYYVTVIGVPDLLDDNPYCKGQGEGEPSLAKDLECFLIDYIPTLTITACNMVLPMIFGILIKYEKYPAGRELVFNLTRSIFLRLSTLVMAFFSVYAAVSL